MDEVNRMPVISPDQVKWIVDHNEQIRGSHRVQLLDASQAWADDRARMEWIETHENPASIVLTVSGETTVRIFIGWQWLVVVGVLGALGLVL